MASSLFLAHSKFIVHKPFLPRDLVVGSPFVLRALSVNHFSEGSKQWRTKWTWKKGYTLYHPHGHTHPQ
jgi:hypothetical protein